MRHLRKERRAVGVGSTHLAPYKVSAGESDPASAGRSRSLAASYSLAVGVVVVVEAVEAAVPHRATLAWVAAGKAAVQVVQQRVGAVVAGCRCLVV